MKKLIRMTFQLELGFDLNSNTYSCSMKYEGVSRIASADIPLAVGRDLGNKKRQRAPAVCKETDDSQVEKESNASPNLPTGRSKRTRGGANG
ncbi:hypothetical protein R1flu_000880 [Riccia fluitans]|uniref:Uncharacterized protein n=1 Tax=Riccia fluitans TaxID=41844 RepID=A0ABD1Y253_9MARC